MVAGVARHLRLTVRDRCGTNAGIGAYTDVSSRADWRRADVEFPLMPAPPPGSEVEVA
jgi:hypothetical protein